MASQITSLTIVYSTVYSGAEQRKHQSSASLAFYAGNSPVAGEFPAQKASKAENVSIWWRHHAGPVIVAWLLCPQMSQTPNVAGPSADTMLIKNLIMIISKFYLGNNYYW